MRPAIDSYNNNSHPLVISHKDDLSLFHDDVLEGLSSDPKRLSSKYFYDKRGDELFQQIMNLPEYYLTGCELEIFRLQTKSLINTITAGSSGPFDLIEMGVGDGTKSRYLLEGLLKDYHRFNYLPIDISGNVLGQLESNLTSLAELNLIPLEGEYFEMLAQATRFSSNRQVILFLGANIGTMSKEESLEFCQNLRSNLLPGDLAIIGFDLKKNPHVILKAYNDPQGITSDFNLNLLERINSELGGNFDVNKFTHYQTYDPETGACKSYLVSSKAQTVKIDNVAIPFKEGEWIFMEVSQKFTLEEVENLAHDSGFSVSNHLTDSKGWFTDSIWTAI